MIDVSEYQGGIDWKKVYDAGHRRAYIKATEGVSIVDRYLRSNVDRARASGVQVGLYHYAHPSGSPVAEARAFLHAAAPYLRAGDLRPALDLEVAEGRSWVDLNEWKAQWLAAVDREIGAQAVFYSYWSFWKHMTLYRSRPVWGAYIGLLPYAPLSWAFRQWSFTGRVPGIRGHVDLDTPLWGESRIPVIP